MDSFYLYGWICNHLHGKVLDEITYLFYSLISTVVPLNQLIHVSKRGPISISSEVRMHQDLPAAFVS